MSTKKIKEYINSDRRDFSNQPFNIDMAHQNPFVQYQKWFEQAVENTKKQAQKTYMLHMATPIYSTNG